MLFWAIVFLVLALIFGLLGFRSVAGCFATIAKLLLVIFLILFLVSLILGLG